MPDDPNEARLFLRYQGEARSAFHRALRALVATLKADAAAPPDEAENAVSPNEADAPAQGAATAETPPNEADAAARCPAPASPNEADTPGPTAGTGSTAPAPNEADGAAVAGPGPAFRADFPAPFASPGLAATT